MFDGTIFIFTKLKVLPETFDLGALWRHGTIMIVFACCPVLKEKQGAVAVHESSCVPPRLQETDDVS